MNLYNRLRQIKELVSELTSNRTFLVCLIKVVREKKKKFHEGADTKFSFWAKLKESFLGNYRQSVLKIYWQYKEELENDKIGVLNYLLICKQFPLKREILNGSVKK